MSYKTFLAFFAQSGARPPRAPRRTTLRALRARTGALRAIAAAILLGVVCAAPARAADDTVTLNFVNADIDAVVKAIAEITGRNFVLDPKSKGTINNVVNLSREGKPVVVYVAPKKRFLTVKAFNDLRGVLAQGETESVERVMSTLHLEDLRHRIAG